MTEFRGQDLTGARFEQVNLRGARFRKVHLNDARMHGVDFAGVRMRGVELDRRTPERAMMRPDDSGGFRAAWAALERLWQGTVARARAFPDATLHESVDGEWSFIQTLRHLDFASAAWVDRMVLGNVSPGTRLTCPRCS